LYLKQGHNSEHYLRIHGPCLRRTKASLHHASQSVFVMPQSAVLYVYDQSPLTHKGPKN